MSGIGGWKRMLPLLLCGALLLGGTSQAHADGKTGAPDGAAPRIVEAYSIRGVVTVRTESDAPLAAFALTVINREPDADAPDWIPVAGDTFSVFKMDGAYEIWVRDAAGRVSAPYPVRVDSGYSYVYEAEGLQHLGEPFAEYLVERGWSLEELNDYIARNTADAGMYTRSGVAAAGVSLATKMGEYGATVPWKSKGIYSGRDDWGALADWGGLSKISVRDAETENTDLRKKHLGMHCISLMIWAYKQAGLNSLTNRGFALFGVGFHDQYGDNKIPLDRGQCGDLFKTTTTHNLMILDKVDTNADGRFDSYLVLEMISPDLTLNIYSLWQVRNFTCYDMSAFFDDTGFCRDRTKYWPGTYHIPQADWPDYVQQAVTTTGERKALLRLAAGLGLGG